MSWRAKTQTAVKQLELLQVNHYRHLQMSRRGDCFHVFDEKLLMLAVNSFFPRRAGPCCAEPVVGLVIVSTISDICQFCGLFEWIQ